MRTGGLLLSSCFAGRDRYWGNAAFSMAQELSSYLPGVRVGSSTGAVSIEDSAIVPDIATPSPLDVTTRAEGWRFYVDGRLSFSYTMLTGPGVLSSGHHREVPVAALAELPASYQRPRSIPRRGALGLT
jgi:hypothetical protein